MKVVQINATCGRGSTGKICVSISDLLTARGVENHIFYNGPQSSHPAGIHGRDMDYLRKQAVKARILGNWGFNSKDLTREMIAKLEELQPDIVHLHNIHGHDCDLELLFGYFRKNQTKLVWTFHDCWAFTGYCMYFDLAGCGRWRENCGSCPQRSTYSLLFDRSRELHERKKRLFTGLDLTIVTPSSWLASLVKESFLQEYPVKVVGNGIDLQVFSPVEGFVRSQYNLTGKYLVLGLADGWGKRKGLDVFLDLARRLPEDYQIVLVGTDDGVDQQLPPNIISIHRTQDQRELAALYSAADVFVNPTREDNYPTVNMEAIACGTPVVTFRTGGSPEMVDPTCGCVVEQNDVDDLQREIQRICTTTPYSREACLKKGAEFDQNKCFLDYIDLYQELYEKE